MAKRKNTRTSSRKRSTARSGKAQAVARKSAAKKKSAPARRASTAAAKRKTAAKKTARTSAARKTASKAAARKASRKAVRKATRAAAAPVRKAAKPAAKLARRAAPTPAAARRAVPAVARKAPALNRNRRTITDEDMVPTPPSTLDLDRSASAVRTGRRNLRDRYAEHTETSPALTGGDVDADWESAYSVGDEAPGGDNPTPDQDIVDEIGHAIGVEYQDNEELKGDEKIADRDRHRWELDPASAEDYEDHET